MEVMLPFSGLKFFLIFFIFIVILHTFKGILRTYISFRNLIFISVTAYIYLFLPLTISIALLVLLIYTYSVYTIYEKLSIHNVFFPMIIIAFPMILYKVDIHPMFKALGISYITFRAIQALVDSHNYGKLNFIEFATFLLFPTTLLAGPIDRSYRFQKDLESGYERLDFNTLQKGWDILITGLLFKFVIAYMVNRFWLSSIDATSVAVFDMVNSAYAYTVYLFFDFAGYSAMAVGLSVMMGINIPMNFNHPYLATNPQEFWRRFHITLGAWLTDYFFKPLYKWLHQFKCLKGKRLLIQNIAIIATFLLMGLWNGFTWYFIFSGFLFGIYSATHNTYIMYIRKGGFDLFSLMPYIVSINLKRLLMVNAAIFSLYFFSGRVPL